MKTNFFKNTPRLVQISMALGLLSLGAFSFEAQAKPFKTDFISLDLPPNWDCIKEELDWVCQPENIAQRSEAIVTIIVKSVNTVDDTFEKYQEVLNLPRDMKDPLGNSYKSEVKYVRFKDIKKQKWIDSLALGPEYPGFYTRYTATIKGKIAALVSYSVGESVYAKWSPVLDAMLDTMEVFFDPQKYNEAMKASGSLLGSRARAGKGRFAPTDEEALAEDAKKGGSDVDITVVAGIVIIVGAVGFILWKRRQNKSQV